MNRFLFNERWNSSDASKTNLRRIRPASAEARSKTYGRLGNLEVCLAQNLTDLRRAQQLRYEVFYEEMSAKPSIVAKMRRRDEDIYDAICDHLLVVDLATKQNGAANGSWHSGRHSKVVGTYRILRQDVANRTQGFYTQSEYDVAPLMKSRAGTHTFMELGRSCVLKPYRNKRTVELLWHGLWTYVREYNVDVMIGCASFSGTDLHTHAMALSYLHHHALAPPEWRCRAHENLYMPMDMIPKDEIDTKSVVRTIPPLIKGYLRLGAFVGDGAVIDHQFSTTDVLIILPVENIDPRYFGHFGAPDEQKSRIAQS